MLSVLLVLAAVAVTTYGIREEQAYGIQEDDDSRLIGESFLEGAMESVAKLRTTIEKKLTATSAQLKTASKANAASDLKIKSLTAENEALKAAKKEVLGPSPSAARLPLPPRARRDDGARVLTPTSSPISGMLVG